MVQARVKLDCLKKDLWLLNSTFKKYYNSDLKVELHGEDIEQDVDFILIYNFPLPVYKTKKGKIKYYESEVEPIVVILTEYPEFGPHGIYILKKSPNYQKIEKILGDDHVFKRAVDSPVKDKGLKKKGWRWLCFHYEEKWKFNLKDIRQGDCLTKYFQNLYAALSGEKFPE